jgi:uncharacterized membrane protein
MTQIAVLVLAGVGLVVCGYFALVTANAINPQSPHLPAPCRIDERSCANLLRTEDAKIFGVPNVMVGILYYGGLAVIATHSDAFADLIGFLAVAGAFTVAVSIYLTIRLLVVHRTQCTLCFALHLINLLLFVIFLVVL